MTQINLITPASGCNVIAGPWRLAAAWGGAIDTPLAPVGTTCLVQIAGNGGRDGALADYAGPVPGMRGRHAVRLAAGGVAMHVNADAILIAGAA